LSKPLEERAAGCWY